MKETKQNIFPICSYGRAENIYYQSAHSLCPQDLESEAVLRLISGQSAPIFPSHILDRADWRELMTKISSLAMNPRVQVSLGREWEELYSQLVQLSEMGWGLDVVVDRSLDMLQVPSQLQNFSDWRWVACPLRFFNCKDLLNSLLNHPAKKEVSLLFLEPRDQKTLLLMPDEVIVLKKEISEDVIFASNVSFLILQSSLQTQPGFYQNPTVQAYQQNFSELGHLKGTRGILAPLLQTFPDFFAFVFQMISAAISEPPQLPAKSASFFRILRIRVYWFLYSAITKTAGFARLAYAQIYWPIHHGILRFYWASRDVFIRGYWMLRSMNSRIYWTLHGLLPRVLRIALWPVLKVYWFGEFQYRHRVQPIFKKLFASD
jgi:hypothetical protein